MIRPSWQHWFRKEKPRRAAARPRLEELESRWTPSVSSALVAGQLVVTGTNTGNVITLDHQGTKTVVNGQPFNDADITAGILINAGAGGDDVDILATVKAVEVNGQGGIDNVSLGNEASGMTLIGARVNVRNPGGFTSLVLNDRADPVSRGVTLDVQNGQGAVAGLTPAAITYDAANLRALTVHGGKGADTFTVLDTFQSGFPGGGTGVDGSDGADTVNVVKTSGGLSLLGGNGDDLITFGGPYHNLDAIHGSLFVSGTGGADTLVINDQGNLEPNDYSGNSTVLLVGPVVIERQDIEVVELHKGRLADSEGGFSPDQRYVADLYRNLLKRDPDAAGLVGFAGALSHGTSRAQVAQLFVTSQEYRSLVVKEVYVRLLHRQADAGGLQGFVNLLNAGGTIEQVQALVAGSQEYFQLHSNNSDEFLAGLYRDALGRNPDAAGLAGFRQLLAAGLSRTQLAALFFTSGEYRGNLVDGFYQGLLRRDADASGKAGFVGLLNQGTHDEAVAALFAASTEYFATVAAP